MEKAHFVQVYQELFPLKIDKADVISIYFVIARKNNSDSNQKKFAVTAQVSV